MNQDPADKQAQHESFRDHIATVDQKGKRIWIYPKKPKGAFYNARTYFSWFLLALFFTGPFIRIGGQPLLLLNFLERKFVILGVAFWPQDFHLFLLAMITFVIFIVLFTAVFGRVFCGWACPQTVFMEMVFRKIEYLIEGDARQQKKLNAMPMNGEKFFKKLLKHVIFFTIAFLIGNWFMMYILGSEKAIQIISEPPSHHLAGFIAVLAFSGVFYFIFSWFREQACVIVCPYGRFQSVLLDKSSIVVSYDFKRGEKRGKISKKKTPPPDQGDCVDCNQCVEVCPTGIDIRNGTQLECVNCTACMDACNAVMDKIGKPRGLIKYASYNAIASGDHRVFTPRVIIYSIILTALITLLTFLLFTRSPLETTILRAPGTLYTVQDSAHISNIYTVEVVNKTFSPLPVHFKLEGMEGQLQLAGSQMVVPKASIAKSALIVTLNPKNLIPGRNNIEIKVLDDKGREVDAVKTSFLAPENIDELKK